MQRCNLALAEMSEQTAGQIREIHERITEIPPWAFDLLWLLPIVITVAVILIFQRQKKIAQNQVDMAKLISELLDKEKN